MIIYKVFFKKDDHEKEDLIGVLTERRRDLRGKTQTRSGSDWARMIFGDFLPDGHELFVVPEEIPSPTYEVVTS